MKKKFLAFLLSALMIVGLLPTMAFAAVGQPLCFTAEEANSTVKLNANGTPAVALETSTNGSSWTAYAFGDTITLDNVGDKVYFRNTSTVDTEFSTVSCYYFFAMTGKIAASGDVTTLLNINGTNKLSTNCFNSLFYGCAALTTAPELPATELAEGCYANMFRDCTKLAAAPILPATTLTLNCYDQMFKNTALVTAPELPATELAESCYVGMFENCKSLKYAPKNLPVTTLAVECYFNMFRNCTALVVAPELPATTLADNCYYGMFNGCKALVTAPELPATTLADFCYANMFYGCSALTTAPELPATTLAKQCYDGMFYDSALTCVAVSPTDPPAMADHALGQKSGGAPQYDPFIPPAAKIVVPPASANAYKNADGWKDYKDDIVGGYYIDTNIQGQGTVTASPAYVEAAGYAGTQTITLTVTPAEGWQLKADSLKVNDGAITLTGNTFKMPAANVTVTAVFEGMQSEVTFNKQGGTGDSGSVTATYGSAMPGVTPPTKTGYNFEGYFDAETSGTKYYNADGTSAKNWNKTGEQTLHAHWTEKTATLTYDANGHGTAPDSVTMKYTEATNAAAALTATGYTFTGWNTAANGTDKSYAAGAEVKAADTEPTAMTLYAQWTEVPHSSGGGGVSSYPVTAESAKNGTFTVDKKSAAAGSTVTVTVSPDKGFTLETITVTDKNGKEIEVKSLGNDKYSFKMPSGKVTVEVTFMEDNTMLNFCVDVTASDYYYDAVLWAYENEICKGTDYVHFSPYAPVSRAQVVTFLWRAAGCPVVDYYMNMDDVKSSEYYGEAVRWALSEGITKGTSETAFSPDEVCTRGQIVTFLARFAGVADTDTASAFADVPADAFFAAAVKWAKDNGVTDGMTATTFEPYTNCNRAQVVTFLYRWMVK